MTIGASETLDGAYVEFIENKETHWYDFLYHIPKTPMILIGIAVVFLIIFFMKDLADSQKTYMIIGIAAVTIVILALTKEHRQDYIEEGEAIKIVKEYLFRKKEEIPHMYKKTYELTGVTQLQQWDAGAGLQPWRWAVAYDLKDDVNCERYVCYINPWDGKIIGTKVLSTVFVGKEDPNIKTHFPFKDRADATFKRDVSQGRTKWN